MEEWDEKKEAAALITASLSSNSSSPQLHKESDEEEGETLRCWHRCSRFYNFFLTYLPLLSHRRSGVLTPWHLLRLKYSNPFLRRPNFTQRRTVHFPYVLFAFHPPLHHRPHHQASFPHISKGVRSNDICTICVHNTPFCCYYH